MHQSYAISSDVANLADGLLSLGCHGCSPESRGQKVPRGRCYTARALGECDRMKLQNTEANATNDRYVRDGLVNAMSMGHGLHWGAGKPSGQNIGKKRSLSGAESPVAKAEFAAKVPEK